ncbi:MAG: hypothetical protein IKN81_00150 [Oscillospiraceae bacterium]|nr:hypothetical protein [Oscillospiraceae bacterium]
MDSAKLKNRMNSKMSELETPAPLPFEMGLAPVNADYAALSNNALSVIRENLKNQPLALDFFDVVKSPSGGSTVFSVPGLNGDEPETELTGIILDYTTPRAYWHTPEPVEGTPPDCMSVNSIISADGKSCAHCPYNDFGSKDGESNAKACKESVLLFLLRPNTILPLLVRVPVTSKNRFLKYTTRLAGALTPINGVVTRITLERATSKGGKPFALFKFEASSTLDVDTTMQAKAYAQQFMEIVNAADLTPELDEAS